MTAFDQIIRNAASPVQLRRPDKNVTIAGAVGAFSTAFLSTWTGMLWLGAIHHEVSARVPALGYWQCLFVYMALSSFGSALTSSIYWKLDRVTDYLKANSR